MTTRTFNFPVTSAPVGKLAALASPLARGAWSAEFVTPSLNAVGSWGSRPTEADTTGSGTGIKKLWNWTGKAPFDSARNRIAWIAAPAIETENPYATRFITYDLATDTWRQTITPVGTASPQTAHGYDNNCIAGNTLYKDLYNVGPTHAFDLVSEVSTGSFANVSGSFGAAAGMDYMTNINALFVYAVSTTPIYKCPLPGTSWVNVPFPYTAPQNYHTLAVYNQLSGKILFGGGNNGSGVQSNKFWLFDGTTFTPADSPVPMGLSETGGHKTTIAAHPSARKHLAFHTNGIYTLDDDTATWTGPIAYPSDFLAVEPADFAAASTITSSIPSRDVIAVMKYWSSGRSRMWVYRPI